MNRIARIAILLGLSAPLTLGLGGCGKKEETPKPTATAPASGAPASAPPAVASSRPAQWETLAETGVGRIAIDRSSIRPQGAQTALQYRLDLKNEQKNPHTGKSYRSTVTEAIVGCKERTMASTQLVVYSDVEGKGSVVDRVSFGKPATEAIAPNSSNEMIWKSVCGSGAAVTPAPEKLPAPAPAKK
jgi:hypothetical protein